MEKWRGDEGEVCSCTMLTTEPHAEVRGVGHHRMPVLLTGEEQYERVAQVGAGTPTWAAKPQEVGNLVTWRWKSKHKRRRAACSIRGPGSRGRQQTAT